MTTPVEPAADPVLLGAAPKLPEWYPAWARELAGLYFSGTTCLFILHGNVHDLIRCGDDAAAKYLGLEEFLAGQVFGSWDVVVAYDLGRGLRPLAGSDSERLAEMMRQLARAIGGPTGWSREPDKALALVQRLISHNLLKEDPADRKRIAVLFDYAQYLVPAGDLLSMARGQAERLVRLLSWAQNPYIKRVNMAFCLIGDKLSEFNDRLVQDPHVAAIHVPLPDVDQRTTFIQHTIGGDDKKLGGLTPGALAKLSSGLNLTSLNVVLSQAGRDGASGPEHFRRLKKSMIERQCQGLVTFVEPKHTLDMVVGHKAAKERLRQDAQWIAAGRLETAPMGYLICGPVGTGKTFMAECYAGTIGIPCVTLRNFRSKYVGETEGNIEQVLAVLRSLGPVIVIIDEADAALGDREASGDSGTSSRVFSMIASQMGDTNYRGRIIWMLLTSRPDLLPIDLKRQGRAEVHIPLFYPQEAEELSQMFRVMAGKNGAKLADDAVPEVDLARELSGADIESIVLSARRLAMADDRDVIERSDLTTALDQFIPSAQGLEKEMQEANAVLECTDRRFLTDRWRDQVAAPNGRTQLQRRVQAIRQLIGG